MKESNPLDPENGAVEHFNLCNIETTRQIYILPLLPRLVKTFSELLGVEDIYQR